MKEDKKRHFEKYTAKKVAFQETPQEKKSAIFTPSNVNKTCSKKHYKSVKKDTHSWKQG